MDTRTELDLLYARLLSAASSLSTCLNDSDPSTRFESFSDALDEVETCGRMVDKLGNVGEPEIDWDSETLTLKS